MGDERGGARPGSRGTTALAWLLWLAFVALEAANVWLVVALDAPADELFGLVVIGFATVGALIASRRPANSVGWLLLAIAVSFAISGVTDTYLRASDPVGFVYVAWLSSWVWHIWVVLVGVVLPLVFPNGRVLSPRWRLVYWLAVTAIAFSIAGEAFRPGALDEDLAVENPFGVHGAAADLVAFLDKAADWLVGAGFLLASASLVERFRTADREGRQQLKWFVLAGMLVALGLGLAMLEVLFPGDWRRWVGATGWFTFLFACLIGIPAATGIAILRHRLFDIDLVIKRTLVYGSLSALLVATYLMLVLTFRFTIGPLAGDSQLAVAASTLAVAGLFRPLRSRIQAVVDRRFDRQRYDAARTLEVFAGRLRDELDLDSLANDLRGAVSGTMAPTHVSLWLRSTS